MSWQTAVRRQAVVAWRDEQFLAAYGLLSAKAQEARAAFEQRLVEHARLYDTVWDPAGFAEPRIDAELRKVLPRALADFLENAATSLAKISPDFAELADALRRSDALALPQAEQAELAGAKEGSVHGGPAQVLDDTARDNASDGRWAITKTMEKLAGSASEVVKRGADIAQKKADHFADMLQDKAGLRDRARLAAQRRITSHWMGEVGDPPPVLAQLIRVIDSTTEMARMSIL
jgi:hypothetical protein